MKPLSMALELQVSELIWPPCGGRIGFGSAEDNHPNRGDWMLLGHGARANQGGHRSVPLNLTAGEHIPAPIHKLCGSVRLTADWTASRTPRPSFRDGSAKGSLSTASLSAPSIPFYVQPQKQIADRSARAWKFLPPK